MVSVKQNESKCLTAEQTAMMCARNVNEVP